MFECDAPRRLAARGLGGRGLAERSIRRKTGRCRGSCTLWGGGVTLARHWPPAVTEACVSRGHLCRGGHLWIAHGVGQAGGCGALAWPACTLHARLGPQHNARGAQLELDVRVCSLVCVACCCMCLDWLELCAGLACQLTGGCLTWLSRGSPDCVRYGMLVDFFTGGRAGWQQRGRCNSQLAHPPPLHTGRLQGGSPPGGQGRAIRVAGSSGLGR